MLCPFAPFAPRLAPHYVRSGATEVLLTPKVLIVDAEHLTADSLALALTKKGFDALAAYDAPTALRLVRAEKPDCAVLDLGLPNADAAELAFRISEISPQTHTLLMSVHPDAADFLQGVEVLRKPVQMEQLIAKIKALMASAADATT